MSPEQLSGDPDAVDTRSDVWALGALGYELLTGRRPFDLSGLAIADAIQRVQESDPPSPASVERGLRGDLDTVLRTAMARDRDRRYAGAGDFAADLRRVLVHEPIAARPATTWYQLRRFSRRHRPLVAGLAVAGLAAAVGAAGVISGLAGERAARVEAEQSLATLRNTVDFLADEILFAGDPAWSAERSPIDVVRAADGSPSLRSVLTIASARAGEAWGDDASIEAEIRELLGSAFSGAGDRAAAVAELERALELRRTILPPGDESILAAHHNLAQSLRQLGRLAEAEPHVLAVLDGLESRPDLAARRCNAHTAHASLLRRRGRYDASIAAAERAIEAADAAGLPVLDPDRLNAHGALGLSLHRRGRTEEAVTQHRLAYDGHIAFRGPEHPVTLVAADNLAQALGDSGAVAEATELFADVLERRRGTLGDDHPDTITTLVNAGRHAVRAGDVATARSLLDEARQRGAQVLGPEHGTTLGAVNALSGLLRKNGAWTEAEPVTRDLLAAAERTFGPEHPNVQIVRTNLAEVMLELEDPAAAERLASLAIAAAAGADPGTQARMRRIRGQARLDLGEARAAIEDLDRAIAARQEADAPRVAAGRSVTTGPDGRSTLESLRAAALRAVDAVNPPRRPQTSP